MSVFEWDELEICSQTVLKVVVVVKEVLIEEGGQRGARVPQRRASVLSSLVTKIIIFRKNVFAPTFLRHNPALPEKIEPFF